ncbi:MAG: four-carbon acid sugar kinase family protein, partial [Candidatus Heimdallarchaeota archaeon]|nr:four-carbon acid sugar kinase family protein [Candidatus Heimdallarchaeota archaeon]
FLYKVCSTFDSSEKIGNIGRAIEIGKRIFSPDFVPVLPAAPKLGRFTVFGNHFAALGQGEIYRLDRHPSIANHPVTPMNESDLRLHLAKQTKLKIGLINIIDLYKGKKHVQTLLKKFIAESTFIIFFDCLYEEQLMFACEIIWQNATSEKPIFFVSSQELGYGLSKVWKNANLLPISQTHLDDRRTSDKGPIFVLSGSCATVTGKQILWAVENDFIDIGIQPYKFLH